MRIKYNAIAQMNEVKNMSEQTNKMMIVNSRVKEGA